MPQLRQNLITGDWVVIAPERAKRPQEFVVADTLRYEVRARCTFCLDGPVYKKENIKEFETKEIYVVPNKFPAFLEDPSMCSPRTYKLEGGFYRARPSTGGHDVIIVKDHDRQLFDLTARQWAEMFLVAKRRYRYFRRQCKHDYSMLIYNQGAQAGASIYHPHAQLFASNIIPNLVSRELRGAEGYYERNAACVFCDFASHEIEEKVRLIQRTKNYLAVTFYAARFPFEIWVLPTHHLSHFEDESDGHLGELSELLADVTARLDRVLKKPPFNFFIHDLPASIGETEYYHWHLEITPRVSMYGGYELGSGVVIDVMAPEVAAEYLRGDKKG